MTTRKSGIEKYRGNITAAYGADLCSFGVTGIPNLLLRHYKSMGISDCEMMLLIQMLRLRHEEKESHPTSELLCRCLSGSAEEIQEALQSLQARDMLALTRYYDELADEVKTCYDFEPLFEKLSDFWACNRVKEIEKANRALSRGFRQKEDMGTLYRLFEKEFGRPLSPIEVERIDQWLGQAGPLLVREALSRSVLMGIRNFKYVDSIILEWEKNNIRTPEEIDEYERRFKDKRTQVRRHKKVVGEDWEDKDGGNGKKEVFDQLYIR
jgi:DNA replication protein